MYQADDVDTHLRGENAIAQRTIHWGDAVEWPVGVAVAGAGYRKAYLVPNLHRRLAVDLCPTLRNAVFEFASVMRHRSSLARGDSGSRIIGMPGPQLGYMHAPEVLLASDEPLS